MQKKYLRSYIMNKLYRLVLAHCLFFLSYSDVVAQDSTKTLHAVKISSPPKTDGLLDEEQWKSAEVVSDFIQNTPNEGSASGQKTEVRILYDDNALYVGAMMYDTAPDSILRELGSRDNRDLNSDMFRFLIDPYLTLQDAYEFGLFASGVQADSRFSDGTYNAVWQSAVKILNNGWSVEMKIPYSAIRFPVKDVQRWGLQFTRHIRRTREFDQWALTPNDKANPLKYWGTLEGISNIHPPVRLSLTPYASSYYGMEKVRNADGTYSTGNSFSYNAGADIRYGINDCFTVDMILLPDFGQVQSDNKIKNLSFREVNYEENRPFFKEGMELFDKNRLFYSRRVGKTPKLYKNIKDSLASGEAVKSNPSQTKLLNATKLTGRNNHGLGIGLFNSITDNTYAEINKASGGTRKILTEPLTNYNAVVFDQQLKNASNVYFINTNVTRKGKEYKDANVSGSGFFLQNKKNTFSWEGGANLSQTFTQNDSLKNTFTDEIGYFYYTGLKKTSGTWQGQLYHETMNSTFNRNDMGFYAVVDYSNFYGNLSFNRYKPWKFILRSFNNLNFSYSYNYTTKKRSELSYSAECFILLRSFVSWYIGGGNFPMAIHDYYEPRIKKRYYMAPESNYLYVGGSTDYRKTIAFDFNANSAVFTKGNIQNFSGSRNIEFTIKPRVRASNKLSFTGECSYAFAPLNVGYVSDTNSNITFGARKLSTYTNALAVKYIFKNDLSLSLNARHYWNTGGYFQYYRLEENGLLTKDSNYSKTHDFSYNSFNIDAVFSWLFAPGSTFSLAYKKVIDDEEKISRNDFRKNFSNTLQLPQSNSISIRILYYLDYQYLRKRKEHKA